MAKHHARTQALTLAFVEAHPVDAARVLGHLPAGDVSAFLMTLPARLGSPVLQHMLPTVAARCLEQLDDATAAGLVRDMNAQAGTAVLRYVGPARRERIIAQLPTTSAVALRLLFTYPEDTAGAWINPNSLALAGGMTAGEALDRVRSAAPAAGTYVYIVDDAHRLKGLTRLSDLLRAGQGVALEQVMHTTSHFVRARASLRSVGEHEGWQEYHALPVLEQDARFIGAIEAPTLWRALQTNQAGNPSGSAGHGVGALAGASWGVFSHLLQALVSLLPVTGETMKGGSDGR